ncbi:MAG: helix-turn-helix domain-containing protein [Spirochaetaceae bacterium]|jgi:transcriptional regulator with XRE-family HTH domain|nr:helix-turn-helix domain-containing protein [Spirochaetaceae bacterium]
MENSDIRSVLAGNVRTFRQEKRLSQAQLAEKVNVVTHHILMIEAGRTWPSPEVLERIAKTLEKETIDLFSLTTVKNDWKKAIRKKICDFIDTECANM